MQAILENEKRDWILIIGSTLSGFILVGFYLVLKNIFLLGNDISFFVTFLIFTLLFDVRHLFSTYARTIFDKVYAKEHKNWLVKSWLAIVLIPSFGLLILSRGEFFAYNTSVILIFASRVTIVLGFYHLVKQNWGFMAIYKKKLNEPDNGSDRWEKLLLLSGSFLPLALIGKIQHVWFPGEEIAFSPAAAQLPYIIHLWEKIAIFSLVLGITFLLVGFVFKSSAVYKYVSRNLGYYFVAIFLFIRLILFYGADLAFLVILSVFSVIFICSLIITIKKAKEHNVKNPKKWAVLISSLLLYNGILLLPIDHKYVLVMAVTLPHNIQYLSFVNFFSLKYYTSSTKNHGLAKSMSQRFILFLFLSFIYAFIFELGRTGIKYLPMENLGDTGFIVRNFILIFFLSMVLHHYYLDAVIWRVRKDKELSKEI